MAGKDYTGRDNLEAMEEAVRYNRFLRGLVLSAARGSAVVLDFGAGSGTMALPVSREGHRVVCVEPDPVLSRSLSEAGLEVHPSLEAVADGSVDFLYSLNVLEHVEDDGAALALWRRKIRPGGKALVYVPAFPALFSSMDRKVGHLRRYRKGELCGKLRAAGFRVAGARYADSLGFAATLLYKAFGDRSGGLNLGALKAYDRWAFPVSRLLDALLHPFLGKNVYALAVTPGPGERRD